MTVPQPPPRRADGKLEIVTTHLEMRARPRRVGQSVSGMTLEVRSPAQPTVSFYRYLYETVGAPYLWYERRACNDTTLRTILHDDKVELHVLYVDECPAGFAEIDRRRQGEGPDEVDLVHFGLVPEYLGRGLGPIFLDRILAQCWEDDPNRVTTHVKSHDHPRALLVYQRMGFHPYDEVAAVVDDPRTRGLFG